MEFQKFFGDDTPGPRPGLGKCKGGNHNEVPSREEALYQCLLALIFTQLILRSKTYFDVRDDVEDESGSVSVSFHSSDNPLKDDVNSNVAQVRTRQFIQSRLSQLFFEHFGDGDTVKAVQFFQVVYKVAFLRPRPAEYEHDYRLPLRYLYAKRIVATSVNVIARTYGNDVLAAVFVSTV